jgi:hypothetical protein
MKWATVTFKQANVQQGEQKYIQRLSKIICDLWVSLQKWYNLYVLPGIENNGRQVASGDSKVLAGD